MSGDSDTTAIKSAIDVLTSVANRVQHTTIGLRNWQQTRPSTQEQTLARKIPLLTQEGKESSKVELARLRKDRCAALATSRLRECPQRKAQFDLPCAIEVEGCSEPDCDQWIAFLEIFTAHRFLDVDNDFIYIYIYNGSCYYHLVIPTSLPSIIHH